MFELRKEVNDLKSNLNPTNQVLEQEFNRQDISMLVHQNEEMAKTIQELKNAAISAIVSKDEEIQEINEKLAKAEEIYTLYELAIDK